MALDNLSLKIIVDSLAKQLVGSTLGKPLSLGASDYAFPYSCVLGIDNIRHGTFVFSLNSANPFLTYSFDRYEKVDDNSPFFNSLKRLSLSTIKVVTKLAGERVVTISLLANSTDLSETNSGYDLILELFPNHPNCYIVAYPAKKIISLYKEHTDVEKGIFITRNVAYEYPAERPTCPVDIGSLEEAKPYFSNALYRYLEQYVNSKQADLKTALTQLYQSDKLYLAGKDILPFNFNLPTAKPLEVADIYKSIVVDQKKLAKLEKEKALISLIEKSQKVVKKKLKNLSEDLQTANANQKLMEYGQMIYLYQGEIKKGDTVLIKDGYTIPLNPLLDAPNNANRYFKKYTKAKAAVKVLNELIIKAKDEQEYLAKKILEAKDGTPRDIMELKSELLSEGYIKEKQGQRHINKVSKNHSYDPHYLVLPDGKIGFGMNGLQNEELTFKIAKKDDLFIHVKDYPGAHVVILAGADKENIKRLAMELSLYLSHLDSGTVMIAKKKDVKKNSERIGLVNILKYETAVVKYIRADSISLFRKTLKS
ncbi:MAG: NFACT family protein [Bacilli bacterium]